MDPDNDVYRHSVDAPFRQGIGRILTEGLDNVPNLMTLHQHKVTIRKNKGCDYQG